MTKVIDFRKVASTACRLKTQGKKIVLVHGCFDPLHEGHRELFDFARQQGLVFVGVDDDESVRELKGKTRPLNSLAKRIEAIKKEDLVDFLFVLKPKRGFTSYSSFFGNLYQTSSPDFLVTAEGEYLPKRKKDIKGLGIKLVVMKKKVSLSKP